MKGLNYKAIKLLIIGLLLALVLTACSNDTPTPAPTTTTTITNTSAPVITATTSAVTAATATTVAVTPTVSVVDATLKTDLVIWADVPIGSEQFLREQITRFGKMYPGVKVTLSIMAGDELLYQAESLAGAGKAPDLIIAPADYVTDLNNLKLLQPADKVLDKSLLDSFVTNALEGSKSNGTQWGVPFNYGGAVVLLYNKKLVEKAPATIDEMVKKASAINEANNPSDPKKERVVGISVDVNEPYWFNAWVVGFGGSLMASNNQPTLDSPAVVNALKFTHDLVYKDKLANPNFEPTMNQIEYAFRDGRLGMMITGDWAIADYSSPATSGKASQVDDSKLELGVAPLPKNDTTGKLPASYNNGRAYFFGAKATGDRLKASKLFVEYMAQPQQQADLMATTHLMAVTKTAVNSDTVKKDPLWSNWLETLDNSKPQPNAQEMRAVWDAVRPNLQAVVADTLKPEDAAKQMQQSALDKIKLLSATK
ncbi:MAG: extracellular solute-binding protein [Chloroflexi bacterium]|uniref:Extracellular solute-binding protein n=1 Tax=Candidatus Chlorohelix allophototropha TaxID=3003348 RepID=A0A8T7M7Y9_9CHLR|nr:extracellular solute-binding protein [Chloroflexota bacterium]WJW68191.1 extracellular solute-binding protein [Chloroflexota bacterium L227-S17]